MDETVGNEWWVEVSPNGSTSFEGVAMFQIIAPSRSDAEAFVRQLGAALSNARIEDGMITSPHRETLRAEWAKDSDPF